MPDLSGCSPESALLSFPGEEPTVAPVFSDRSTTAQRTPAPSAFVGSHATDERSSDPLGLSLSELRTVGTRLVRAYGRLEEQYQEVDGRSVAALETLASIERRVGSLEILRDLSSTIDERFVSLARIQDDLGARTTELQAQEVMVGCLEGQAARAASDARSAEATLAALQRRFGPTGEDIDRRASDVGAQERRLAEMGAVATTMESALDGLQIRITELTASSPALLAAQANVAELQRLVAEASAQLERLQSEKAGLKRVLAETRAELGRVRAQVRRLSLVFRFRQRVGHMLPRVVDSIRAWVTRVRPTMDWGSVRSADIAPVLMTGLASIALIALVASAVLGRPDEPPVLEAAALVEPVDPVPPEMAPRTSDIHLPATRLRAVPARAGGERSRRAAAAASR